MMAGVRVVAMVAVLAAVVCGTMALMKAAVARAARKGISRPVAALELCPAEFSKYIPHHLLAGPPELFVDVHAENGAKLLVEVLLDMRNRFFVLSLCLSRTLQPPESVHLLAVYCAHRLSSSGYRIHESS